MISTLIFAAFLLPFLGIDPDALRQELESAPWRPSPGTAATVTQPPTEPPVAQPPTPPAAPEVRETSPARIDVQGGWQIQLAALANPEVARKEQARLEKDLGAGTVVLHQENGLNKLRWGRFPSREAADAARAELRTYRLDGFAVKAPAAP